MRKAEPEEGPRTRELDGKMERSDQDHEMAALEAWGPTDRMDRRSASETAYNARSDAPPQ